MRSPFWFAAAGAAALLLSGCTQSLVNVKTPVRPPVGLIYTDYTVPLTTWYNATPAMPPKVGKSRSVYFQVPLLVNPLAALGINLDFAVGETSIDKAAENGNIAKVHYADVRYQSFVTLVGIYETTVYGE